jgi:FkbM family methyltransferase
LRWLFAVARNVGPILRSHNLQTADAAVGPGPFAVRFPTLAKKFSVSGQGVISGIREMYVRNSYLKDDLLRIEDGATVVDLGANLGLFTKLALAHGDRVRVIAVEPSLQLNREFDESLRHDPGFRNRATLLRGFVGQMGAKQQSILASKPNYANAPRIGEDEILSECGGAVDFLKCDIEGGEYWLLDEDSRLLSLTRNIAIEIHSFAGDPDQFVAKLQAAGFEVRSNYRAPDGTRVVLAAKS